MTSERGGRAGVIVRYGLLAVLTALLIGQFFAPFARFTPDGATYTFTGWQMVTGYLRFRDAVIGMPLLAKLLLPLPPLLGAAGLALLIGRKASAAAVCYLLAGLCPLAAMMVTNTVAARFIDAGASTIVVGFHAPLAVAMAAGIAAAVLAMSSRGSDRLAAAVFRVFACLSVGAVLILTVYMIVSGLPAIAEIGPLEFLFGTQWNPRQGAYGIGYMILASVFGMAGAIALGVPIGLLTAIFLAEVAPPRLAALVRPAVELLAGIPSVIYGFFGMVVIVPALRRLFPGSVGDSLLAMILILAIMVLPTIISVSETALRAVPPAYKEASLALGNTPVGTIFGVLVPAARSGILSGVILGVGRAIGETMAVIMVCGNIVQFPGLLDTVRPLTTGVVLEMNYAYGLHRQALFSIGLVLFVFIMVVNVAFTLVSKRGVKIDGKE